jgi:hypothetical protein
MATLGPILNVSLAEILKSIRLPVNKIKTDTSQVFNLDLCDLIKLFECLKLRQPLMEEDLQYEK